MRAQWCQQEVGLRLEVTPEQRILCGDLPGGYMLLNVADIVVLMRLTAGGQRRFSLAGFPDLQRMPLIEGLFFAHFSAYRRSTRGE